MPRRPRVGAEDHLPTSLPSRTSATLASAIALWLWGSSAVADTACRIPAPDLPGLPAGAPVQVEADAATYQPASGRTEFEGNAELTEPGRRLSAARMTYQRDADQLDAEGHVELAQPDLILQGDTASYRPTARTGQVSNARYAMPATGANGEAKRVELLPDGTLHLTDPVYTLCPPGQRAWAIEAERMMLDRETGRGTATGAHLELGGVSLPGLPTLSFPIGERRHSGLLVPSIGYGSANGADVTIPYYFNLAPNYDLTVAPRLMSRRGILLGGELRYLQPDFNGQLRLEYLPDDRIHSGNSQRGGITWRHDGRPFGGWRSYVNASHVSDVDYLADLDNTLSASATRNLERIAQLSRRTRNSTVILRAQDFQNLDPALPADQRSYGRLPQLLASLDQPFGDHTRLLLDTEFVSFDRSTGVTGQRVDLSPTLAARWEQPWGYVEPRAGVRYTGYRLSGNGAGGDSPDRFTQQYSLDGGLFFDRPVDIAGRAMTQTIEPRLYYLYVPYSDQSNLPVFDTAEYDFRFDSLFQNDRFSGPDRVGDSQRLSVALTSRLIDDRTGMERVRVGIGQIFYFDDRRVTLPNQPAPDTSQSAMVVGIGLRLDPRWRLDGSAQWDPEYGQDGAVTRGFARIGWDKGDGSRFSAGYRLRRGETEQLDLAGGWRVNARTRLVGRWRYSLRRNQNLEALAGIEYGGSCCWKVRTLLQRHLDTVSDKSNLAVLLQLELTGLGNLGKNIDDLMSGGLAGYRATPP